MASTALGVVKIYTRGAITPPAIILSSFALKTKSKDVVLLGAVCVK